MRACSTPAAVLLLTSSIFSTIAQSVHGSRARAEAERAVDELLTAIKATATVGHVPGASPVVSEGLPAEKEPAFLRAAAPEPETPREDIGPRIAFLHDMVTPRLQDEEGIRNDGNHVVAGNANDEVQIPDEDPGMPKIYSPRHYMGYPQHPFRREFSPEIIPEPATETQLRSAVQSMASLHAQQQKAIALAIGVMNKAKILTKRTKITRRLLHQERAQIIRMDNYVTFARKVPNKWSYEDLWGHPMKLKTNKEGKWEEIPSDEWESDDESSHDHVALDNLKPTTLAPAKAIIAKARRSSPRDPIYPAPEMVQAYEPNTQREKTHAVPVAGPSSGRNSSVEEIGGEIDGSKIRKGLRSPREHVWSVKIKREVLEEQLPPEPSLGSQDQMPNNLGGLESGYVVANEVTSATTHSVLLPI